MTRGLFALALVFVAYQRFKPLPQVQPEQFPLTELSEADLQLVPGIGPVMAKRLKSTQEKELTSIYGVGEKSAQKWSPYFRWKGP